MKSTGQHGVNSGDDHTTIGLTNTMWPVNRKYAELNLTDNCNLSCPNCQACCPVAKSEALLSLQDVRAFVDQTIKLKYPFEKIKLSGGEPTLHPNIEEIFEIINQYRQFNKQTIDASELTIDYCQFHLLTNGRKHDIAIPDWINTNSKDSVKTKPWLHNFESMYVAAVDLPNYQAGDKDFRKGCHRITRCGGLTLGCNGRYYPCMMAYHVDRVFQMNLGFQTLSDFMNAKDSQLRDILEQTCRYCGLFKYPKQLVEKVTISPSWQKALRKYNNPSEIKNL